MHLEIKEILTKEIVDQEATIRGWVRSVRKSKKFSFVVLNDGTCQKSIQIVVDADLPNYEEVKSMLTGTSCSITGNLVKSGGKGQSVEMQATAVEILGKSDESYPIQKKNTSLDV